jgi:5-hydroxyisourate hydrolase
MSGISTHVLDTATGRPAAGIKVRLLFGDDAVGSGITDDNGRIQSLLSTLRSGTYSMLFDTGDYFTDSFYPEVSVSFIVRDPSANYHIALLLSPFGYTTYRGS